MSKRGGKRRNPAWDKLGRRTSRARVFGLPRVPGLVWRGQARLKAARRKSASGADADPTVARGLYARSIVDMRSRPTTLVLDYLMAPS
jgi:hypothetical protein